MGDINVYTGPMKCGKTRKDTARIRQTINCRKKC